MTLFIYETQEYKKLLEYVRLTGVSSLFAGFSRVENYATLPSLLLVCPYVELDHLTT